MPKIGLEIHGYLNTNEKLFCSCKTTHGKKIARPNTLICPVCCGMPGAKPLIPNTEAVKKAIQIALILGCKINSKPIWQRKHYSWPDLPKGYQNTLSGPHAVPIGEKGNFIGIGITECHLEEDPASWNPLNGQIDYNRSGLPLIEIVTDPDFKTSQEVIDWLKQLLTTLNYIKAIDKSLGIKADVNVSVKGGKRIEMKNINSLKKIKAAIEYELNRQDKNPPKTQETRMFDSKKGISIKMRDKEQAQDYRFISDPDLPVIHIKPERIKKLKSELPETPHTKLQRLIKKHKIPPKPAQILTKKLEIAELFEKVITQIHSDIAIPWITIELLSVLNYNKKELDSPGVDIKPEHIIELLKLLEKKQLTEHKTQEILRQFIPKSFSPKNKAKSHSTISNKNEIEKLAKQVLTKNKQAVKDYTSGNQNSLNFLIGQIMKISNKRADYKTAREILVKLLK